MYRIRFSNMWYSCGKRLNVRSIRIETHYIRVASTRVGHLICVRNNIARRIGVYANTPLVITHKAVFTIAAVSSVSVTCVSAHGVYVGKKTKGPEQSCNNTSSCRSTDKLPCDRVFLRIHYGCVERGIVWPPSEFD